METIYLAGGCLWGVQAYVKTLPGVIEIEAGRGNGNTHTINGEDGGDGGSVKTEFGSTVTSVAQIVEDLFLIIDPDKA